MVLSALMDPGVIDRSDSEVTPDPSVEQCVTALGAELTAYIAGADSVGELAGWLTEGGRARERVGRRLAAAAEVVRVFASDNIVSLAAAWLRRIGGNHEPAPATALRVAGDDDAVIKGVVQAAASWAADRRLAGSASW